MARVSYAVPPTKRLKDMHRVFANRVSTLDADAWRSVGE
jgi:hypothetical protein